MDEKTCWNCGHTRFENGGHDDVGNPITVCVVCNERQEEE